MLSLTQLANRLVERRRAKRLKWNVEAVILIPTADANRRPCVMPTTILDASPYGLRVSHRHLLATGSTIRILTPEFQFSGHVVWTQAVDDHYESGLSLAYRTPAFHVCVKHGA
jgi:hypothetical protein